MYNQNNPYGQNNYQQPMYGQQPVNQQSQYNQYQTPMNQPQYNQGYYMQQPPKKSSSLPIIIVVVLVIVIIGGAFFMSDSDDKKSNSDSNSNETIKKDEMANTSWLSSRDGSAQIVLTADTIKWYKDHNDHNDNYHAGKYKYYRGKEAIEHMSKDLSKYGVTEEEIYDMINRDEKYEDKNFVVFDCNMEESIVNGQKKTVKEGEMIWYGFILNNDTELYLVNVNALSYLYFKKE